MLTTRETLDLAAFLELPNISTAKRTQIVDRSLDALGLAGVQHRRIGERSAGTQGSGGGNGLSGGERRRLSVALELISTPRLFLADEPTTGLDSSQAEKVIRLVQRLATDRNIPCICTIHQPRTSIWNMFDSFVLLAPGGRVCYMGDRKKAKSHFAKLGYECPEETNPAEFFVDLVSIDTEDEWQAQEDEARIEHLFREFTKDTQEKRRLSRLDHVGLAPTLSRTNIVAQFIPKTTPLRYVRRLGALFLRSWKQNTRNGRVNAIRLGACVGQAILFSSIFKTVQKGTPTFGSVADRTALLSFGTINMTMMALMKTIDLFSKEKGVVLREQSRKQYTHLEYLLAKILSEIPLDAAFAAVFTTALKATTGLQIPLVQLTATFSLMTVAGAALGFAIGGVTPNAETAMTTGVPILIIFMVVGIINPSGVSDDTMPPPKIVQWLKAISPIRYAIEALCVGEFKGMVFDTQHRMPWQRIRDLPKMGAFSMVQNGEQVLGALGLEKVLYTELMKNLAILAGVNLMISWLGLTLGNAHFVEASSISQEESPIASTSRSWEDYQNRSTSMSSKEGVRIPLTRII